METDSPRRELSSFAAYARWVLGEQGGGCLASATAEDLAHALLVPVEQEICRRLQIESAVGWLHDYLKVTAMAVAAKLTQAEQRLEQCAVISGALREEIAKAWELVEGGMNDLRIYYSRSVPFATVPR